MDTRASSLPWEKPGWFERVGAWVGAELGRLGFEPQGQLELVRTRPWAAIARVATAYGDVWFKEAAPTLAFDQNQTEEGSSRGRTKTTQLLAV